MQKKKMGQAGNKFALTGSGFKVVRKNFCLCQTR